jgi:transposase
VAITAVARKLVTIAYLMLKNDEPYRYAKPELMNKKFAKLRGTGREPAEGPSAPRPRTKAKEGLEEVYRSAQLPPVTSPEGLPAGERRMLAERGLEDFVRGLYDPAGPSARRAEPGREAGEQATKSRVTGRQAGRPN